VSERLEILRSALSDVSAWVVGGAVRDELLGRPTDDYDLAVAGDSKAAARTLARATGAASFPLSESFGAWRVVGREGWHVDLVALREDGLEGDLRARDFTVNAMARPLGGGELIDPTGGRADLEARRLRMTSERALPDDPLRALRAIRFAVELSFALDRDTAAAVRRVAPRIGEVAGERVFAELRRIVCAPAPAAGLALMSEHGVTAIVLPELEALRGVTQSVFHHLDVHDHTLEVLDAVTVLERDPAAVGLGRHADAIVATLAEPLADGLSRGQAMRFAALLHDAAKPATRAVTPEGRVTFIGHDREGARLAVDVLRRLRTSQRLIDYVTALTRNHLRLGYMVHELPLTRRSAWRYLEDTAPYETETTVLTVADRLATRGRNAGPAIAAHITLAGDILDHCLARRTGGRPAPLVRGDELMRRLGVGPGPMLGRILAQLEEDAYAGDVTSADDAVRRARELLAADP
jgi:poly(A) polymerase